MTKNSFVEEVTFKAAYATINNSWNILCLSFVDTHV